MCYSQALNCTGKEGPAPTLQEYQRHVSAACNRAAMTSWMVKKQFYKAQCSKTAIKVKLPCVKVTLNVIRENRFRLLKGKAVSFAFLYEREHAP